MAKKKTSPASNNGITSKELALRARYPIGLLFQVSTLAACIAYLVFTIQGTGDMAGVLYRSVIVFLGCSVLFGVVMVAVVTILHKVTMKEIEDSITKARLDSIEMRNKTEVETGPEQPAMLEKSEPSQTANSIGA